jgi:hypothetical protein
MILKKLIRNIHLIIHSVNSNTINLYELSILHVKYIYSFSQIKK